MTGTVGFFSKYKDAILFNRNLIISGAGGFFSSAYASRGYSHYDSDDLANSLVALAVEYGVYIPVFSALFYVDNRSKYVNPATGKRDSHPIRQELKKLLSALSV